MRVKTVLPVIAALFCSATAGVAFVDLVPKVRAVDAATLFASSFGAGASFAAAIYQARHKKPE
jgi:hypothetical protein